MSTLVRDIRPLSGRVVVIPDKTDASTKSGILLKSEDKTKTNEGVIAALADDIDSLKVGDHVLYEKFAGAEITWNDEACVIMTSKDICAVIEKD
jgi:chaperonin GroES